MARLLRPSLTDLVGVFLVVAVALLGANRLFGDSDPATHTATGRWILEHGEIPRVDPFTEMQDPREWFAYEWLADVVSAMTHRAAGWAGLVALSALLIAVAHVLLYRLLVRRGSEVAAAFTAVLAAAAVASAHWLARPHLWTVLLVVICVVVLESVVHSRLRPAWLAVLPPLVALWTNLHGGFLAGLGVIACYAAGSLLHSLRAKGPPTLLPLVATLVACCAATLVNPRGWRTPAHLLAFFVVPRPELQSMNDFAPASFDRAGLTLFGFLLVCVVALVARAAWRHDDPDPVPLHPGTLLAWAATSILALTSIRHAEIAAVFGAIVIAAGFSTMLRRYSDADTRASATGLRRHESRAGGALFAVSLIVLAALAATGRIPAGYDPADFPVEMVGRLKRSGPAPTGVIFAPDLWGGYLIHEWPEASVFVDGRWDMYGGDHMRLYLSIYSAEPRWSDELDRAGVELVLLPPDAPLAPRMRGDHRWILEESDPTTLVFRRSAKP